MKSIKSPHSTLKTSWVQTVFTKSKTFNGIKRSLGTRPKTIIRYRGTFCTSSPLIDSNPY